MSRYQSGFYWSKRQWVAVASAGPYARLHFAPTKNYNKWHSKFIFLTAISVLVISNHNSLRVLFDKIASVCFIWKNIFIFYHWKWPAQEPCSTGSHCRSLILLTSVLHWPPQLFQTGGRGARYYDERGCISVCMSVCSHIGNSHVSELHVIWPPLRQHLLLNYGKNKYIKYEKVMQRAKNGGSLYKL